MIRRRHLIAAAALSPLAAPSLSHAQAARTVKMGSLRLIHSMTPHFYQRFAPAGLTIEVITFDSPTDCKNAVVTGSVGFGGHGIAAGILGAAAGEPIVVVGGFCNKGMGVIAKKGSGITNIAGLRGKRVGIWPGSTQEVFILERLRMNGMTVRDIQSIRVPFGEMNAMLARGEIDAYVGAEPGPGLSISSGVGELVEYPYDTAMGGLNMIFSTSQAMIDQDPALVRTMLDVHRKASEYMMAHKSEVAETTVRVLGAPRAAVEQALGADNVEYIWKLDDTVQSQSRTYAEHMLSLRQIRQLPDFAKMLNARFSNEVASA
ncbi:NrtA/SsuA/CpmA family ABC transporter substrate-binding protein [Roseomonas sp. HJA6]|uniref:NrtA/SsuA/CpmA family ABC transporter substrate-binding protein n=1 Tax=Roseomonas alba TaxID=2846776 RepID=A0ABS7AB15_9PROT|nr:NrtA/SsuA/CpmA family ABC transporter substrate-binding protein [Neoroseomonas alba]MBW6399493.1 NrtA/SsuA/CpmA family ABC transporter substrate-binding protein [Neoroseomonas alba]